jgi:uncharacterized protein (TIGR02453 family)
MKKSITKANFTGFTPETLDFFVQLKKNNNKLWFDEHREIYEKTVREPAKSLVDEVGQRFITMGLPFIADQKRSLFRINRDIRFSNNKDPYKTNLGVYFPFSQFLTDKKPINDLGLYFHIEENETFIAGGLHTPEQPALNAIRSRLAEEWEELLRIINNKKFMVEFPDRLHGESLKRIPHGYPENHPAADLLKLKQFLVSCNLEIPVIFKPSLIDMIINKAIIISPFLEYFQKSISLNQ